MRNPPAFQFYPLDFLGDLNVQSMTDDQVGKYTKLLCHCWIEDGLKIGSPLVEEWLKAHPIIGRCFIKKEGKYRNPRLDRERDKQKAWAEKSARGGLHSAENKKLHRNGVTKGQPRAKQRSTKGQLFSLQSSSSIKNKSRDLSSVDIKLTQSLIDGILENNPEASVIKRLTPKRKEDWINQCRLLREADGRTPEEILAVIQFSQTDDFWKTNILSMPKLREKWDQLWLKAQTAGRGSGYVRDEGARYVKPTPAEQAEEDKFLAEYYAAQKKFMEAKGYKSDEEIPFEEIVTFADFKSGVKWERR